MFAVSRYQVLSRREGPGFPRLWSPFCRPGPRAPQGGEGNWSALSRTRLSMTRFTTIERDGRAGRERAPRKQEVSAAKVPGGPY